jgi:hypothetical protein
MPKKALIARQQSLHPVDARHAGITVDRQAPEPQRCRACHARRPTAAQDRPQACQQLARVKGFGQIVIAPEFQANDTVHLIPAGR